MSIWRTWVDALGAKADEKDNKHSDNVAIIRTVILLTYLITNGFIIAGVIKHWNN